MYSDAYGASPTIASGRSVRNRPIGLDHHVGVVLRLEAADVEDVTTGLQAQARQRSIVGRRPHVGAVGKVVRRSPVGAFVVRLDHPGVRDDVHREPRGHRRARPVVGPADPVPLCPLPLEAVHVEDHALPGKHENDDRGHVCRVADIRDDVEASDGRVDGGEQRMDDRLQVLRARGREADHRHPAVFPHAGWNGGRAPVDCDAMPPLDQARPELLRERFESAIVRGHTPDPENGDPHPRSFPFHPPHSPDPIGRGTRVT